MARIGEWFRVSVSSVSFVASGEDKPPMTPAPRVLVIRRRYLGDIVLLGPVFRNLRLHWPGAHLAAVAEPAFAPLLALNPDVNETFVLPRRAVEWPGFLLRLRRARFTHVLDLDNTERTALITRATGAPCRVAIWYVRHAWPWVYTAALQSQPAVHEQSSIIEYYLSALGPAGVPVASREVRLVPRAADLVSARLLVHGAGKRILLHPGSRSAFRMWPAANFAAVCDRVQDELGAQVFVLAGPGEQDTVAAIRAAAKSHLVTINTALGLPQFAALASLFDLMLCHDSGPMHVAAAVGTPVVALLGSQNPVVFAPAGSGHIQLQPPLPCAACVSPGQCVPGDSYRNYCVRNITVDRVVAAVREKLQAPRNGGTQRRGER
jgi:ADP-heptose:LPS heptosyltransferase